MSAQPKSEKQWKQFHNLSDTIRSNIVRMAALKKALHSDSTEKRRKSRAELESIYVDTAKLFTFLKATVERSLNRQEKQQLVIANLCEEVNEHKLLLKNCAYEKANIIKNITVCRDLTSQHTEPTLIPTDEFLDLKPECKDDKNDPHELHLKELRYELDQRKKLLAELQSMQSEHNKIATSETQRRAFLNSLVGRIDKAYDSIQPLRKFMSLPSSMVYPDTRAMHLPPQLYAIYHSFISQKHVNPKVDDLAQVKIEGEIPKPKMELKISVSNLSASRTNDVPTSSTAAATVASSSTAATAASSSTTASNPANEKRRSASRSASASRPAVTSKPVASATASTITSASLPVIMETAVKPVKPSGDQLEDGEINLEPKKDDKPPAKPSENTSTASVASAASVDRKRSSSKDVKSTSVTKTNSIDEKKRSRSRSRSDSHSRHSRSRHSSRSRTGHRSRSRHGTPDEGRSRSGSHATADVDAERRTRKRKKPDSDAPTDDPPAKKQRLSSASPSVNRATTDGSAAAASGGSDMTTLRLLEEKTGAPIDDSNDIIHPLSLWVAFAKLNLRLQFREVSKDRLVIVSIYRNRCEDPSLFVHLFAGHNVIPLSPHITKSISEEAKKNKEYRCMAYSWAQELAGNYLYSNLSPVKDISDVHKSNVAKGDTLSIDGTNMDPSKDASTASHYDIVAKQLYYSSDDPLNSTDNGRPVINLQTLFKALNHRVCHRISLSKQLKSLKDSRKLSNGIAEHFRHKTRNTIDAFVQCQNSSEFAKMGDSQSIRQYSVYCVMTLSRDNMKLRAAIEVPPAYPTEIPHIRVRLDGPLPSLDSSASALQRRFDSDVKNGSQSQPTNYYSNASKNIEISVNTDLSYLSPQNVTNLFSLMIYKLQLCFDIHCDASPQIKTDTNALKSAQMDVPWRAFRGRDRRQEYNVPNNNTA